MLTYQIPHAETHQSFFSESTVINTACDDNYIIGNHNDIRKKLNQLQNKNALLSIKIPGKFTSSTLLTTIIHIEGHHIFLEGFQNERFNKDLLRQGALTVSGNFEGIAFSFILCNLSGHVIDATFILKATFPQSMMWLQRRDTRRIKVPLSIPVKIQYKGQDEYFSVGDISVAGLSYSQQLVDQRPAPIGKRYTDCNIVLPDNNVFQACLEITNSTVIPYKQTKQINRIGCEIKGASYRLDTALQRLINQIDFYYQ